MPIKSASELVTSRQETRTGFIEFALEKNRRSKPFIDSAKAFRHFASQAKSPKELLEIKEIQEPLLAASGLSDKSLKYFTCEDKQIAISELIKNFLEPAGDEFVDEVVYRYLLIKGDSLGGSMRNIIGMLAQQKLIRLLLSVMSVQNIDYQWLSANGKKWRKRPDDDYEIENDMKAISWSNKKGYRTFAFNLGIPTVGKNIDLCLFSCEPGQYDNGNIVRVPSAAIMFGELKGGVDPAGADEHWKTASAALARIRTAFASINPQLQTSFIGAAIESSMAEEIFSQVKSGELAFASNLTKAEQVYEYCAWILAL